MSRPKLADVYLPLTLIGPADYYFRNLPLIMIESTDFSETLSVFPTYLELYL